MINAEVGHLSWLGFIPFGIVMGSLFAIILAATFGKPRKPRVTLIFLGSLVTLLGFTLVGLWVAGIAFSVVMG